MKHKKIFLLCGVALICCLIGLAGCKQEHVHNMQFVVAAEPTCTEEGRKAYWFCKDCNKYFADEGGATEISPDSLAIEAAGHDISEEWRYNGEEHWHECKRCSEKFESAPHVFGETDYCTCGFEIPSTENLAYRLSEDKSYCIITGIGDAETEYLFIPREIDGKPVKEIADNAFKGNTEIKSVRISSSVVSIGDHAFAECSNLDGITIGINVKTLGDNAFSHCKKLTEINFNAENMDDLGDIVMEYYNTAFFDAGVDENGITVTFGDSVERIPAFLFVFSKSWEGSPNIKSVKMGKNITTIGDGAFGGCSTLEKVAFSEAVTTIGLGAFAYCSGLTGELVLPDKVKTIGLQAFSETEIIGVTIPSSVNYVGRWAFSDCKKLNEVRYKGDIADWCAISFGGWIVEDIENLYINNELIKDLIIPEGVTDIGSYAFNGFSGLTSVTISDSVTSIGSSAFKDCSGLTSVTIPDSVTDIGSSAFSGCSGLTSITIPFIGEKADGSGATNFGYIFGAFSYSSNSDDVPESLKEVIIKDGVTSIDSYAFYECKISSITIPESLTSIGEQAFYGCYNLVEVYNLSQLNIQKGSTDYGYIGYYALDIYTSKDSESKLSEVNGFILHTDGTEVRVIKYIGNSAEITIPDGVTIIGEEVFSNSDFVSVIIPDSVTTIGDWAFSGCCELLSITLGSGVNSIGDGAFSSCSSLTSITIPEGVTAIGNSVFSGCSKLKSVSLGSGVKSIGNFAFGNCGELMNITIPNGVTSIGERAFSSCSSLTSITIPKGVTVIGDFAFVNCFGLEIIYYNAKKINDQMSYDGIFSNVGNSQNGVTIIFGETVQEVPAYLFNKDTLVINYLRKIVIGNNVTSIGDRAFNNCYELASVSLGTGVKSIGDFAFSGCSVLTSIVIPESVTDIGEFAFDRCGNLKDVYYAGNADKWADITIRGNNSDLESAKIYFYSPEKPPLNQDGTDYDGNYWRYVDNAPTPWVPKEEI